LGIHLPEIFQCVVEPQQIHIPRLGESVDPIKPQLEGATSTLNGATVPSIIDQYLAHQLAYNCNEVRVILKMLRLLVCEP
jgi:hypothetical protein